jgi:hypothetical protein
MVARLVFAPVINVEGVLTTWPGCAIASCSVVNPAGIMPAIKLVTLGPPLDAGCVTIPVLLTVGV